MSKRPGEFEHRSDDEILNDPAIGARWLAETSAWRPMAEGGTFVTDEPNLSESSTRQQDRIVDLYKAPRWEIMVNRAFMVVLGTLMFLVIVFQTVHALTK